MVIMSLFMGLLMGLVKMLCLANLSFITWAKVSLRVVCLSSGQSVAS